MDVLTVTKTQGIAILTLNRPEKRNALTAELIDAFSQTLKTLSTEKIHAVIVKGAGGYFCSGNDIKAMQEISMGGKEENQQDAQSLANLIYQFYTLPIPTIVLAEGVVLGGGMGLVAAADIAIAATETIFGLPEVSIGLTPSIISPYIISAIGERLAPYYFFTGKRFSATEAERIGLINHMVPADTLLEAGMALAETIGSHSPAAIKAAKELIRHISREPITAGLAHKTAEHLADIRMTPQAQEGMRAFLEKRKPQFEKDKS